jgi:hypothetical protein
MVTKQYLIQSIYGYVGYHNGVHYSITSAGLTKWEITFDGTIDSLQLAFLDAQSKSENVDIVNKELISLGIPISYAMWHLFSVIDSF